MRSRFLLLCIAVFWVTMNFLLWRTEYSSHAGGEPVPAELVWRKILTAPDASSLSIYQHGERSGFCEISTSVEMEMAKLDEDKPPPEGIIARAGYQIRLNGTAPTLLELVRDDLLRYVGRPPDDDAALLLVRAPAAWPGVPGTR